MLAINLFGSLLSAWFGIRRDRPTVRVRAARTATKSTKRWLVHLPSERFRDLLGDTHIVCAHTASEARAEVKRRLGLSRRDRLPIGTSVERLRFF